MSQIDEGTQRRILEDNGWIPVGKPLGEGGGARVFKVVSVEATTRFVAPLLVENDMDRARIQAQDMAQTIAEIADGTQPVVAAGKVAFKKEPRTKREIAILRDVQHPNLIRMLDSDKSADPCWYVMPVMKRGTLKDTGPRFTGALRAVVHGMIQIADALGALHWDKSTTVHRDVKPGNIFIGDGGEWILGDPGVAYRDDGADPTTTRAVSKDWFPRWYGDEFGHGSVTDIYMLGAVGFYLLTGQLKKPLDPTHLTEEAFDLPKLFSATPGVRQVYELLLSVVRSKPDTITLREGRAFAAALRSLLPVIEEDSTFKLQQELRRVRAEPRTLYSYAGGERGQDGGGLQRIAVWIPGDAERMIIFITSSHNHSYALVVVNMEDGRPVGESSVLDNKVQNVMPVPAEMRGSWVWLALKSHAGLRNQRRQDVQCPLPGHDVTMSRTSVVAYLAVVTRSVKRVRAYGTDRIRVEHVLNRWRRRHGVQHHASMSVTQCGMVARRRATANCSDRGAPRH